MVTRTKIYSVYIKQGDENPLESAVFVKQGFDLWAFLFGSLWCLFNRLWLAAVVLGIVNGLLTWADTLPLSLMANLLNIWFGFEAGNFLSAKLEKRGYILFDISTGIDRLAAETRFYDKYLLNRSQVVKQGSFSSMRPATS